MLSPSISGIRFYYKEAQKHHVGHQNGKPTVGNTHLQALRLLIAKRHCDPYTSPSKTTHKHNERRSTRQYPKYVSRLLSRYMMCPNKESFQRSCVYWERRFPSPVKIHRASSGRLISFGFICTCPVGCPRSAFTRSGLPRPYCSPNGGAYQCEPHARVIG
jgi:hypothetical protein